jgi:hypothetical protein
MTVFSVLLVAALVAGAALAYLGVETVRTSRVGKSVSTVTDPALPGFEAFLDPTPTLLVVHGTGGSLVSASVLALNSGDVGGSVLLIPPATRVPLDDRAANQSLVEPVDRPVGLADVAAFVGDPAAIRSPLQVVLGVGLTEVAVIDDARWAELVGPVAPLTLENPDELVGFPRGALALAAEQVGPYLSARREGESDLARLYRQQLFFEAWATAVGASPDPAAVPGEVESGIGRFVRGLARGPRRIATLPVVEVPDGEGTRTEVDAEAANDLLSTLVPFPTAGFAGGRVRVRVLDGIGDTEHVVATAPRIVPAGSEIVVVGNADAFDYETTEIRYHHPTFRRAAQRLQEALGAGRLIDDPRQTDAFDVTIVLGTDV